MSINLDSISKTGTPAPPRIIVYGVHGIGKSTFASDAKNPIFIQTEDGLSGIKSNAFPVAKSFDEVMEALRILYKEKHSFETVVLDSLDWLEPLVWQHASKLHGKTNIEDFGYGKGYVIALDYWRQIIDAFNALRRDRNMTVVLTAHCEVKKFDAPDSEPYDRYQPKMHKASSAMFQEWADVLGFANYKVHTKESDTGFGQKRVRAIGSGERLLHTTERPTHLAKSRYNIPETLPLDWKSLSQSIAEALSDGNTSTNES
ncbi:MAG: hypothetical protein Unbinned4098contig1000_11 [Prokaryotic dsDNA virus sp.]|nr:MAG: hypothetical protein Unbinned4098contig1000_11 [Prokaryotic dsDNA virus sp.]|tara:strand:- start:1678 stop:2454 length:777 start_codon:yes stop_codon:yes gene_type:complete